MAGQAATLGGGAALNALESIIFSLLLLLVEVLTSFLFNNYLLF